MHVHKLFGLVICLSILLNTALAQEKVENYNTYKTLELEFKLSSGLTLERSGSNSRIDSIEGILRFFPRKTPTQNVKNLDFITNPEARESVSENAITFTWGETNVNHLEYEIKSTVVTQNSFPQITREIKFPLQDLDDKILVYTKPTKYIDIDQNIESQARTLVAGETDMAVAVFKIADWVKNNIKYDLSTLTAEVVQKSTWVYSMKEGVCDEITNLFISMLRSQGIPARFVSGMVYSNVDYKFGAHGWAEVYFPGFGWVPYDVTFGQYGWIDPSHVKLNDDVDSGSASAQYSWRTSGVEIDADDIKLETSVKQAIGAADMPFALSVEPSKPAASSGSHVPLLVTIENKRDYYISASIIVKKAPELTEKNMKEVLLRPKETKTVAWILKLPQEADEGYIYTSAIEVTSSFGGAATSEIKYAREYSPLSLEQAKQIIKSYDDKSKKREFSGLQIRCLPDKEIYYSGDDIKINCNVLNNGNNVVFNLCLKDSCENVLLQNNERKDVPFTMKAKESGRFSVVAENEEMIKHTSLDLNVIKVADLSLVGLKPTKVSYDKDIDLVVTLEANSELKDINIDFGYDVLHYDTLEGSREIVLKTNGETVFKGLTLHMNFKDDAGKQYQKIEPLNVVVEGAPWYVRFASWLVKLFS